MACSSTSNPATVALPAEGGRKQVSMRMVVVLPAPLGPRNPTICPLATSKEIWSTAIVRAYLLVSSFTVIIKVIVIGEEPSHHPIGTWRIGGFRNMVKRAGLICQRAPCRNVVV